MKTVQRLQLLSLTLWEKRRHTCNSYCQDSRSRETHRMRAIIDPSEISWQRMPLSPSNYSCTSSRRESETRITHWHRPLLSFFFGWLCSFSRLSFKVGMLGEEGIRYESLISDYESVWQKEDFRSSSLKPSFCCQDHNVHVRSEERNKDFLCVWWKTYEEAGDSRELLSRSVSRSSPLSVRWSIRVDDHQEEGILKTRRGRDAPVSVRCDCSIGIDRHSSHGFITRRVFFTLIWFNNVLYSVFSFSQRQSLRENNTSKWDVSWRQDRVMHRTHLRVRDNTEGPSKGLV